MQFKIKAYSKQCEPDDVIGVGYEARGWMVRGLNPSRVRNFFSGLKKYGVDPEL